MTATTFIQTQGEDNENTEEEENSIQKGNTIAERVQSRRVRAVALSDAGSNWEELDEPEYYTFGLSAPAHARRNKYRKCCVLELYFEPRLF